MYVMLKMTQNLQLKIATLINPRRGKWSGFFISKLFFPILTFTILHKSIFNGQLNHQLTNNKRDIVLTILYYVNKAPVLILLHQCY